VHEHELVEMAAGGLDYSVRKKLHTQYLRDMAQLADRVRQVERLKARKARTSRFPKKEKLAYVDTGDNDPDFDWGSDTVEDNEINLAELKEGHLMHVNYCGHRMERILKSLKMINIHLRHILLMFLSVMKSLSS